MKNPLNYIFNKMKTFFVSISLNLCWSSHWIQVILHTNFRLFNKYQRNVVNPKFRLLFILMNKLILPLLRLFHNNHAHLLFFCFCARLLATFFYEKRKKKKNKNEHPSFKWHVSSETQMKQPLISIACFSCNRSTNIKKKKTIKKQQHRENNNFL